MESLAMMVALIFLAVLTTGPAAAWLAMRHYKLASLFVSAAALMVGIHWFIAVPTFMRFIGLGTALLGVFAIWYTVRLNRF